MKKFTILFFLTGFMFVSTTMKAQPGCGDTDQGLLTITEAWQTKTGDAGIIPYWSFDAVAGIQYSFSSCLCTEDTYLRIYDDTYAQVAFNDDNGPHCSGTTSSIDWTCTTSGTYYVSIANYYCDPFENAWTFEYMYEVPPAPPENDECVDAEVIGEVVDYPFTTDLATTSGVGTHNIGKDIWYVFTATGDGTIDVGLCGSSFDTKLAVWDECGVDELAYNDDGCYSKAVQSNVSDVDVVDGEDYYIQVGGYSTNSGDGLLTIEFTPAPDCPQPTDLTATNITTTSAELGWTEAGEATVWNVELGESGFTPTGTPTDAGVDNPFVADGLTTATAYDFYVQADCDAKAVSAWSGPFTFTTLCEAIVTLPWTEGFENATMPDAPDCWLIENGDWVTTNNASATQDADARTGAQFLREKYGATNEFVWTPGFQLEQGTSYDFSFWWAGDNYSGWTGDVFYNTEASSIDAIQLGQSFVESTQTTTKNYAQVTNTFMPDVSGVYYFAIRVNASYSPWYLSFDDFSLDLSPDCLAPTDLTATNITTSSAELGWTEQGSATMWNIELGESGFTPTGTPTNPGVDNPFVADGLDPATAYDFYVQADCGTKDASTWAGPFTFTTLCATVDVFPFVESFEDDSETRGCWTQIQEVGTADWSFATGSSGGLVTSAFDGALNARFVSTSGSSSPVTKLVSPVLDLSGMEYPKLSFYYAQELWYSDQNETKVYYRISDVDPWMEIAHFTEDVDEWTEVWLDLPEPSATYQIAFEGINNWGRANVVDLVTVADYPPSIVSGVVTDFDNGNPIGNVEINVMPGDIQVFTNATGEYEVELEVGVYDLTFTHPDYNPATESGVEVLSGETTTLDVELTPLEMPLCAQLVGPADNSNNNLPESTTLEWAPDPASSPADGYIILLYNITDDVWIENETDLGNVTTYTPVDGFDWGKQYAWMILPYNIMGQPESCTPWYFNTSYSGIMQGVVTDEETGLPLPGVDVTIEQVFPNPGNVFNLATDDNGEYSFEWESAVYNVTFSKYAYKTSAFNNQSIYTNQVTQLDVELIPEPLLTVPFLEDWSSGSYDTQAWSYEGNWYLDLGGNPGPSAIFYWDPHVLDYEHHLQSFFIDTRDEEQVFLQFDLELSDYYANGAESLTIKVFDGSDWYVLDYFVNFGSFDYTTFTYDISDVASGNIILVDFVAAGADTWGVDWWHVDNIMVTNDLFDIDKDKISEVIFYDDTKQIDITLTNHGAGALEWEAQLLAKADWLLLEPTSGTIMPGSETITLTLDGGQAAKADNNEQIVLTINEDLIQLTVDVEMKHYEEDGQEIMIPGENEWGYISSYVNMDNKMSLEDAMEDIEEDMIIMVGTQGIYWPIHEINTIGDYNNYEGYKIKMGDVNSLAFLGQMVEDQTVTFPAGTFIVPILSEEPVDVMEMLDGEAVEFAFGIDGTIYWPDGPIYTLETFYPGYGYLIKFNAETTLDFGAGLPKGVKPNTPPAFENITTWNDVYRTGDFHIVGISNEAASELEAGDIVGVFNIEGQCTGMMNYTGKGEAIGIPVYADDVTTEAVDGMIEYEPLIMKVFRDGREIMLTPVYSTDMPNSDGLFAVNGVSMILSFKEGATAIGEDNVQEVVVYPNPSDGIFNIDGINSAIRLQVTNSQGQIIAIDEINDNYTLDMSGQPTGVYFIRLVSEQGIKLVKVVKQ